MSKVVITLLATTAGLGLVSLHLVKQLREGDAAIAELKGQVATLQEQVEAARTLSPPPTPVAAGAFESPGVIAPTPEQEQKEAPKIAATQSIGGVAAAVVRPSPLSNEDRARMMREHRERQRQLMQDPEYREAVRLQARTNFARQYPGVIQELGLDQAQAEDFFELLAEQQMRGTEEMEPLWEMEIDGRDPAAIQQRQSDVQRIAAEMHRKNDAELAARFGQDKLQAWKEYQSTIGQRWQLEHMRNTLAAQGLPLNEDMSKPMLKALAEVQKLEMQEVAAANRGRTPAQARVGANVAFEGRNMEQQLEDTKKRNQRVLDAISSYLTFEQRQALEREQEAQVKMQEAQLRMMRARGNSNPPGFFTFDGTPPMVPQQLQ